MVRPKKHLGQHFLTDQYTAQKIVNFLPKGIDHLLEIGPGKGILTQYILKLDIANFKVIEIDKESVEYLKLELPGLHDKIIHADFLKFDLDGLFDETWSIIGNFPFNISSQILFRVLEFRNFIDLAIGMFQKEVAERIASPPGNKTYGILSVLLQAFYNVEYLTTVSQGVFFPPPKVKSAVIKLTRNEVDKLDCDEKLFFTVVKTAFNQRRKTLRNSLRQFGISESKIHKGLLDKRAEQLSVEDFVDLTSAISIKH